MSALDAVLSTCSVCGLSDHLIRRARSELDVLRSCCGYRWAPKGPALFLGRFDDGTEDGGIDLWYRFNDGLPEVDWYSADARDEEWTTREEDEDECVSAARLEAWRRAKEGGLPVHPFSQGDDVLVAVKDHLTRISTDGRYDEMCVVVGLDGECYCVPYANIVTDGDVLSQDCDIDTLVDELAKIVTEPPDDIREAIRTATNEELTPAYLRMAATMLEDAAGKE